MTSTASATSLICDDGSKNAINCDVDREGPIDNSLHEEDISGQNEAVILAFNAPAWKRHLYTLKMLSKIMRTEDVKTKVFLGVRISLVQGIPDVQNLIRRFESSEEGKIVLKDKPQFDRTIITEYLSASSETLGGAYARWAKQRNFDPGFYPYIAELDPDEQFVLKRISQVHDLTHVVTGYDSTYDGEADLLIFNLAQYSSPLFAFLGGAAFIGRAFTSRKMFSTLVNAYKRGKLARDISTVNWEALLDLPLVEAQRRVGLEPVSGNLPVFNDRTA